MAKVTPFAMLVPVFGMAAAALVFGERPNPLELAGGIVLLAGVAIAVIRRRAAPAGAPSPVLAVDVEPPAGATGEAADLTQLAPTTPGCR